MSRVQFFTKEGLEVVGGWDHPLRYFFLTIFDAEKEAIWSELDHFSPSALHATQPLREVLHEHNITPPEGFWDGVERREGNVYRKWSEEKKVWYGV
jgi:hypothetical protein